MLHIEKVTKTIPYSLRILHFIIGLELLYVRGLFIILYIVILYLRTIMHIPEIRAKAENKTRRRVFMISQRSKLRVNKNTAKRRKASSLILSH